jgi:hypothetical protein
MGRLATASGRAHHVDRRRGFELLEEPAMKDPSPRPVTPRPVSPTAAALVEWCEQIARAAETVACCECRACRQADALALASRLRAAATS